MLKSLCAIFLTFIATLPSHGQSPGGPKADAYPIIAELVADPARFDGRSIAIYGLVIEADGNLAFLLQDVSQRPLRIVGNRKFKAKVGDQLMVVGVFHARPSAPYVSATSLLRTKVIAGGGCC
jgi:hypothetical protein